MLFRDHLRDKLTKRHLDALPKKLRAAIEDHLETIEGHYWGEGASGAILLAWMEKNKHKHPFVVAHIEARLQRVYDKFKQLLGVDDAGFEGIVKELQEKVKRR